MHPQSIDAAVLIAGQAGTTNGTSNGRINENETVSISSEAAVLIPARRPANIGEDSGGEHRGENGSAQNDAHSVSINTDMAVVDGKTGQGHQRCIAQNDAHSVSIKGDMAVVDCSEWCSNSKITNDDRKNSKKVRRTMQRASSERRTKHSSRGHTKQEADLLRDAPARIRRFRSSSMRSVLSKEPGERRLRPRTRQNRAYATHSEGIKTDSSGVKYRIGQTLLDPAHSIPFTSPSQACDLLTRLAIDSPLWAKRTSGEWSYAKLAGRSTDNDGKMALMVVLNASGKNKKILERKKWERCLRLAREDGVADAASSASDAKAASASDARVTSFPSVNDPAPREQLRGIRRQSSSKTNANKHVSFHCMDVADAVGGEPAVDGRGRLDAKLDRKNRNDGAPKSPDDCTATISSATIFSSPFGTDASNGGVALERILEHPLPFAAGAPRPMPPNRRTAFRSRRVASTGSISGEDGRANGRDDHDDDDCDRSPEMIAANLRSGSFCSGRRERMRPRRTRRHGDFALESFLRVSGSRLDGRPLEMLPEVMA